MLIFVPIYILYYRGTVKTSSLLSEQRLCIFSKVKVKLSLCLISYALRHEDVWGSGGIALPFLTSALDGGEWSASRPCRFNPGERASGTHWIGGWVGPRVRLDAVEKRKILHCRESNPGRPARSYTA
jgi:hypothetical protein